jgi:hypothetical protein
MTHTHLVSPELFHVGVRAPTVGLLRLTTGEFHIWRPGGFGALIYGDDAILATRPLAESLHAGCGHDIDLQPATIVRRSTAESWSSYVELVLATDLHIPNDLPRAVRSTSRAWRGGGRLVVRGDVKDSLMALRISDLTFSSDFSMLEKFGLP